MSSETVTIRLQADELVEIDRRRGETSRSEYLRAQIRKAIDRAKTGVHKEERAVHKPATSGEAVHRTNPVRLGERHFANDPSTCRHVIVMEGVCMGCGERR